MTTMISESELVVLRGGVAVPLEAVLLLLDLERRGLDLRVDQHDGTVVCRPGRLLTEGDKRSIRLHRDALKALFLYCEGMH